MCAFMFMHNFFKKITQLNKLCMDAKEGKTDKRKLTRESHKWKKIKRQFETPEIDRQFCMASELGVGLNTRTHVKYT